MTIYCPTCNRSSDQARFIGEFCEFCTADRLKIKAPETIKLLQCRFCERISVRNEYKPLDARSLAEAIKKELHMPEASVAIKSYDEKHANAEFTFELDDVPVKFDKGLEIKIEHKTCQQCYRMSSGYYEALIQVRGERENIDKFARRLSHFMEKNGAFLSKIEEMDHGYDIYVSSKLLTNEFFSMNKLKPKKSFKLYGLRRGNRVYRNIYSLRL